ncbi:MAG: trypsin-like peptidase domain-containing protein, partial [Proteobacteria bacterium]|nr:trypsin-like peptidase domain-containing protein [Pseudomonadota bacterium]
MKKRIWFLGVGLYLILFPQSSRAENAQCDFTALQKVITEVSQAVQPAVVHIQAILKQENRKVTVVGSGVIIDPQGHIITNEHVVSKAVKITVTIPNFKKKFPAKVKGTDKQTDLAVIQIEPEGQIPVAQLGNSDQVQVGEWVLAIGNPYGLDGTVSFGIVSGRGRNVENGPLITDFLQTDAMIDFGSSGGPLVNLKQEVIGINSMMQGRGIGFTIPVNTVLEVKNKILSAGKIDRGWIGVTIQPLNRDLAEYYGIPQRSGVVVNAVFSGSPAERAGIVPGDIVFELAGNPVECENDEDIKNFVRMVSKTE